MTLIDLSAIEDFDWRVHRDATELISEITGYFHREQTTLSEFYFVPTIIMSRIFRLRDAALILTKAHHPAEAAIILLSQLEAKLDLAQAARDVKWATRWVEHKNTRHSITPKVNEAIAYVFDEKVDRMVEQSIYRYLSALKHGNPATSELGYQVRRTDRTISISTGEIEDEVTQFASTMMGRYATYQLAWAAQAINVTIRPYAQCKPASVKAVQDNWLKVKDYGPVFAAFLSTLVEDRDGHLDMATTKQ